MAMKDEFWVQPQAALTDEAVNAIYAEVSDQMRIELAKRGANVVDQMLAERTVFLYAHMRQREAKTNAAGQEAFANDRARKETMQLWAAMAENLQRRWLKQDQADLEHTLKERLAGAVDEAMLDMDPALAGKFREALLDALENAGL